MPVGIRNALNRFFGLENAGTTAATELRAGLTTFLTMAYILFVNPAILGAAISLPDGSQAAQLMTATALAAAFGCLLMGLWARLPYGLAPGMGLNAYFAYTVVGIGGIAWQTALGAVFLSGILFFLISVTGLRQRLIAALPDDLKHAATAGIGCFLATIGLINSGLVQGHPATLVTLGALDRPGVWLAVAGLLLTGVLMAFRVRGAVLLGILAVSLTAMATGAPVFNGESFAGFDGLPVHWPVWPAGLFAAMDIPAAIGLGILPVVFTFLFVDFFDTTGTLIALAEKTRMAGAEEVIPQSRAAFCTDGLATSFGALMGTSTTTSYIESAAGIAEGGRSGLTAVTVGLLFLASLFFWPLAALVPAVATAPVLILIGAMMMFACAKIGWREPRTAIPAFLTMLGMPLTYSITNGLAFGIIAYAALHGFGGRARQVHWLLYLLAALLVWRFAYGAGG